jgi:hypothetical protein
MMGPISNWHRGVTLAALLAGGCGPLMAPPAPCPTEPCSTGTPRFPNDPGRVDAGPIDTGVSDAAVTDSAAVDSATSSGVVRGSVGEVRVLPRARAENTVLAVGWQVRSLLDNAMMPSSTDVNGAFSLATLVDAEGIGPIRATPVTPGPCAIGHFRSTSEPVSVLSVSASLVAESMAPTGITIDPALAHVVVEVESSLRTRVRGARVTRAPGGAIAVAYDVDGALFGVVDSTGSQGTAIIPNLDAPAMPVKIELVIEYQSRLRRLPVYVARGCTTFATVLSP